VGKPPSVPHLVGYDLLAVIGARPKLLKPVVVYVDGTVEDGVAIVVRRLVAELDARVAGAIDGHVAVAVGPQPSVAALTLSGIATATSKALGSARPFSHQSA
jgi:hypothetical protein